MEDFSPGFAHLVNYPAEACLVALKGRLWQGGIEWDGRKNLALKGTAVIRNMILRKRIWYKYIPYSHWLFHIAMENGP